MPSRRPSRTTTSKSAPLSPARAIARAFAARGHSALPSLVPALVAELVGAERVRLMSQEGARYKVLGSSDGQLDGQALEAAADVCSLAIKLGDPVIWQQGADEPLSVGYASALAVPFELEGQPRMALSCYRDSAFGAAERDRLIEFAEALPEVWAGLGEGEDALENLEATRAELRQSEFKLEQLREQLASSEQLKAQFVATMSHELRTPLNVVLGFGSLLADEAFGPLNPEQDEACQKIMESTERLAMLINDLLDFSRLQACTLELNFGPVEVSAMIEDVLADLGPLAERKELSVEVDAPADLPRIRGDMVRLEQTLKHLLDNAIKFTASGGAIGVRARQDGESMAIEVWDTGIGIPEEAMHRLFDRFYQVDSSNTRLYGGTGIGLALVKELVERHGGQVQVDSRVGQGSTFRIVLPIAGVPAAECSPSSSRAPS